MSPTICLTVGGCHWALNRYTKSDNRATAFVGRLHRIDGAIAALNSNNTIVVSTIIAITLVPGSPRLFQGSNRPVFSPVIPDHDKRCIGSWRGQNGQEDGFARFYVNNGGILNETFFLVLNQIGHEGRQVGFCLDSDALEHTPGPHHWRDDNIPFRGWSRLVLFSKTS